MKVAVVGCGLIGRSWSMVFARSGHDVTVFDLDEPALGRARGQIEASLRDLADKGLLHREEVERVAKRITLTPSLADSVSQADYVQESVPERLDIKRELFVELDRSAPEHCILASSTSGFPASTFTRDLSGRHRCLVAHPVNPPHLIPLVELVPAPWTDAAIVDRTQAIMRDAGQSPVVVRREIQGFVLNRLQGAVLAEAFRLVKEGVCGAKEVDATVRDGLARRWVFMGPFETIDLNAPEGVADYCQRYGGMYYELQQQTEPLAWEETLIRSIAEELSKTLGDRERAQRSAERDGRLAQVARFVRDLQ